MSTEKVREENEKPEEPQNLSATAMFLRGFDSSPGTTSADNAPGAAHTTPPSQAPVEQRVDLQLEPRDSAASAPGEFTGLFQTAGSPRTSPSSGADAAKPTPPIAAGSSASPSVPGEFTRIFVSTHTPSTSAPASRLDESPLPAATEPGVGSRSKGFSSPGLSDSASGEGGFTQFFKSASEQLAAPVKPSAFTPPQTSSPIETQPIPSGRQELSGPSVTSLLSSLSSATSSHTPSTRPEPEPYRPAPAPSWHNPIARSGEPQVEAGGVTQLIQKLAHEPATAPLPPTTPAPAAPPVASGPGDFTRMISTLGASGASPSAPSGSAPAAAQPAPAPQAPALPPVQIPVKLAVQVPPVQAPTPPAGAAPAAAPKAPQIAVPAPPVPKLAPAPPLAVPKGKFDAIVPLLLIVNTFLLLAILLVLLFQARGH
jgi:hypothetical protein